MTARAESAGRAPVVLTAKEHPLNAVTLMWRVLDVACSASVNDAAAWYHPPHPEATGRAFIARDRDPATGAPVARKIVRVIDRHPSDDWADVSEATLRAQLDRAYLPPLGWVERHGQTGVGGQRDRGAGRGHSAAPAAAEWPRGAHTPERVAPRVAPIHGRTVDDFVPHAEARRARRERNA